MKNEKEKKVNDTTKKNNKQKNNQQKKKTTNASKTNSNVKETNKVNNKNNKAKVNNKQNKKNNSTKQNIKSEVKEKEEKVINVEEEVKDNNIKEEINDAKKDNNTEIEKELKKEPVVEEKTSKTGLIVLLGILLIIVGICIFYQVNNKTTESNTNQSEESNEIMDNFYKYFNSKKTKVIYYASSTCGYCSLETPIMEQISKDYNMDFLHIDSSKLSKIDREKMLKELNIDHATPTTVIVKNGKIIDTQIGYVDGSAMIEFLKNGDVLTKDAVYTPEQYLTFINYDEYKKLLDTKGKHIITVGQTGCSHCTNTKPVLNQISKDYDITINYLNITDMTKSENTSFIESLSEIGYDEEEFVKTKNFGTPLTLIIENGKVISYVSGERPTAQFIRAFKKAGVISE